MATEAELISRADLQTDLALLATARTTWEQYLDRYLASPRAPEARQRLIDLEPQDLREIWATQQQSLLVSEADSTQLDQIFPRFAGSARTWLAMDLLPNWGEAESQGQEGEAIKYLSSARLIATALRERELDEHAALTLEAIETANAEQRKLLAQAHADFGLAFTLYRQGDFTAARDAFAAASQVFSEAGSPFSLWADYHAAVCLYQHDAAASAALFDDLLERIGDRPFWPLRGWTHWMRGLAMRQSGRSQLPLADFEAALAALERAGDNGAVAVKGLLAGVYQDLGFEERAWELRIEAIRALNLQGNHRPLHNELYMAVLSLLDADMPRAASWFGREMLANAEAAAAAEMQHHEGFLAETHQLLGRIHFHLGDAEQARTHFETSRAHAREIPDATLRFQLEGEVAAGIGEMLLETDSRAAAEYLSEALRAKEQTGFLLLAPRLYRQRAQAYGRIGDTGAQGADLAKALKMVEKRRTDPLPGREDFRISYWETVQGLVDDMIHFQAVTRRDAEAAWQYAAQARGRALMDRLAAELGRSADASFFEEGYPEESRLRKIQKHLPADAVLLEYALLDDRLLVWWLRQKGPLDMAVLTVSRDELAADVDQLGQLVAAGEGAEVLRPVLAKLFDRLVRPVAGKLRDGETLLIAPDRDLHRLPWIALFDAERKRYLLQDHSVVMLPSASLLTLDRQTRSMAKIEEGPVLVVGNPAFNRDLFTDMPSLPAAEAEAGLIEELYPRSLLLTGHEATEEAFRHGLDGVRVIHVSSHARVSENQPLLSSLVLAPAGEADTGLLEMPEIYELPLETVELVVLAACRSVDAFPGGGREGVAGLARAFLAAGAGSVVASLWDVDDEASLMLMERFHQEFRAGKHPAEALRDAQLALLESDDPRLQSPALWAGFQTVSATPP